MTDVKKVRAAAAARGKQKKSSTTTYIIWIGGMFALVIGGAIMSTSSSSRGSVWQTAVNDPDIIIQTNRNARTWKAGPVKAFEDWSIGDVKTLQGISISSMGGAVPACQVPEIQVPPAFDAREKWPQCFTNPVYAMSNCTASWAISAASALSNRFCIADPNEHAELMLSPQQLLSCDRNNAGCDGGDLDTVWNHIAQEGLVSELCFPYQADGSVPCNSNTKCDNEVPLKGSSHCVLNSEAAIRKEILTNGPVVAPLFLMDDFLVYKGGIYQSVPTATQLTDNKRQRLLHAVKLIGWGTEDGKNYWIIENSFGKDWGEEGFGRVFSSGKQGDETQPSKSDGIVVESYVLAGTPASIKVDLDEDSDDMDEVVTDDSDDVV